MLFLSSHRRVWTSAAAARATRSNRELCGKTPLIRHSFIVIVRRAHNVYVDTSRTVEVRGRESVGR